MFARKVNYDASEAEKLAKSISQEGLFGGNINVQELFYCFQDLVFLKDRVSFGKVIDSVINYAVNHNTHSREQIRMEILARLECLCLQVDTRRFVIGLPVEIPEHPGKVYSLFSELYGRELTDLQKHYIPMPPRRLVS
jgi:hypothetical protein